jgi:hypothetical protein
MVVPMGDDAVRPRERARTQLECNFTAKKACEPEKITRAITPGYRTLKNPYVIEFNMFTN